ncbi:MAG: hypothetical protein BJ554DRAFT_3596 [Olpidium bornovanus]|uniref:Rab-GAP TBC domain-containing protein n=1 Tax=Olpidium bornovanus TaxID=278681 RepID=A0A8H7ZPC5_9FUNG|nr:MAG: hypothetical protein BJ554DRAFT_3596 [Olpidium bornovanus]
MSHPAVDDDDACASPRSAENERRHGAEEEGEQGRLRPEEEIGDRGARSPEVEGEDGGGDSESAAASRVAGENSGNTPSPPADTEGLRDTAASVESDPGAHGPNTGPAPALSERPQSPSADTTDQKGPESEEPSAKRQENAVTSKANESAGEVARNGVQSADEVLHDKDEVLAQIEAMNKASAICLLPLLMSDAKARHSIRRSPAMDTETYVRQSMERADMFAREVGSEDDVDWDFWGTVIEDYDLVAKKQPKALQANVEKGIPPTLRGMAWQLIAKSRSPSLEADYATLLKANSPHEKSILRDLARTFPKHEHFREKEGEGQTGLYNVVKAYSILDPEVGYCQGLTFLVGPLLLNVSPRPPLCEFSDDNPAKDRCRNGRCLPLPTLNARLAVAPLPIRQAAGGNAPESAQAPYKSWREKYDVCESVGMPIVNEFRTTTRVGNPIDADVPRAQPNHVRYRPAGGPVVSYPVCAGRSQVVGVAAVDDEFRAGDGAREDRGRKNVRRQREQVRVGGDGDPAVAPQDGPAGARPRQRSQKSAGAGRGRFRDPGVAGERGRGALLVLGHSGVLLLPALVGPGGQPVVVAGNLRRGRRQPGRRAAVAAGQRGRADRPGRRRRPRAGRLGHPPPRRRPLAAGRGAGEDFGEKRRAGQRPGGRPAIARARAGAHRGPAPPGARPQSPPREGAPGRRGGGAGQDPGPREARHGPRAPGRGGGGQGFRRRGGARQEQTRVRRERGLENAAGKQVARAAEGGGQLKPVFFLLPPVPLHPSPSPLIASPDRTSSLFPLQLAARCQPYPYP